MVEWHSSGSCLKACADISTQGKVATPAATDCCPACGSVALVKVKGCVRCEACKRKGDCDGWGF